MAVLLFNIFEMAGIVAFAVSGALLGVKKGLDPFGVVMLAVTTAVGGGIIRDIIIGNTPPLAFTDPLYFLISLFSATCVLIFYERLNKLSNVIMIFDAIGLGIFTAIGADIAVQHKINTLFIIVSLSVITGIGGGIIRDIFVKEIPAVFRKEIYALASVAGGFVFFYAREFVGGNLPLYLSAIVTLAIRIIALNWNIHLPVLYKSQMDEEDKLTLNG